MDKPISPSTNSPYQVQNYHFQIQVTKLIPTETPVLPNKYNFFVSDGLKNYETSKEISLTQKQQQYTLTGIKMNFVAISYNPGHQWSYTLRMVQLRSRVNDKEIGEYIIDANSFIDQYNENENGAFSMRVKLSKEWSADVQLYVGNNRYGVEQTIHQLKHPKPKQTNQPIKPRQHQKINKDILPAQTTLEEDKFKDTIRPNRFQRFSPKKVDPRSPNKEAKEEVQEESKHDVDLERQPSEHRKPSEREGRNYQKIEKKQEKKTTVPFQPKEQWLIPDAEKFLTKKKPKTTSAQRSKMETKLSERENKSQKESKSQKSEKINQSTQNSGFTILSLKVLLPAMIALLVLLYLTLFRESAVPPVAPEVPSQALPKGRRRGKKSKK